MQITVLVKQVPESLEVDIDPEKGTLRREGAKSQTNPLDLNALEAAIFLKEQLGAKVTALSMGPLQAKIVLAEALALGADKAILLSDPLFAGSDTLATAFTLSQAINKIGANLIICGLQSTDGDTGQVGPGVAEFLGIPHVSYVLKIVEAGAKDITVITDLGNSYDELMVKYPCLISVSKEVNQPRLPSYLRWKKVRRQFIEVWNLKDLYHPGEMYYGLDGSATQVVKTFPPTRQIKRVKWEGTVEDISKQFCNLIEYGRGQRRD